MLAGVKIARGKGTGFTVPFALLRIAGLALAVWFQFALYPGHGYTRTEGQIFVPQIERLESPGLLTRDLVAMHPNLTFTIFDEATLLLHQVPHANLRRTFEAQALAARAAGEVGVFLLAMAAGLTGWWPVLVAAMAGFVGTLPGCEFSPFGMDITPARMAFGLVLLAAGLFAREKPLLAGLFGGLALIYDPPMAAPLWLLLLSGIALDQNLRPILRPTVTTFAIFLLLLANFAQLQPATAETRGMFERLPPMIEAVQQFRTPELWVTQWQARALLLYVALTLLSGWAVCQLWGGLSRVLRWFSLGLPLMGIASLPVSALLLDWGRLRTVPLIQPARWVAFTAVFGALTCAIAFGRLRSRERWLFLAGPLLLMTAAWVPAAQARERSTTEAAANWARNNTWGASMFLFADAGRDPAPGQFRAESSRAVWVDWEAGKLCDSSDLFADEWQRRWHDTMLDKFSTSKIQRLVALPIDYFVLDAHHAIAGVKPVFVDAHWIIYDAHDLREVLPRPS